MDITVIPDIEHSKVALEQINIKAPGTCGEFIQGALNGEDFLINCPINLFSYAQVRKVSAEGLHFSKNEHYSKVRDTLLLAADQFSFPLNYHVRIRSAIPRGKGMASSSADIAAVFEAVCQHSNISLSPEAFAHIVTEVEPSDCVNFSGISHINHLTGQLISSMPAPQDMSVLVVDCGGEVDTLTFDRMRARNIYKSHQAYIRGMCNQLKLGLQLGDLSEVAKAATLSAQLNQQLHYKPQFDELLAISLESGALGVNCAHSGTVLGVLYRRSDHLKDKLTHFIGQNFGADLNIIGNYEVIGGGCNVY